MDSLGSLPWDVKNFGHGNCFITVAIQLIKEKTCFSSILQGKRKHTGHLLSGGEQGKSQNSLYTLQH